ncbi:MAG: hypothetical protein V4456_19285 [Bacteroidota bacterium]
MKAQKYHLQINYWRLLGIILVLGAILFVLLLVIVAYEESDQGYEIVYKTAGVLFRIITFPLILFSKISAFQGGKAFIIGTVIGVFSWSVLTEMLFIRYSKKD